MRPLRGLPAEVRALVGVAFMVALGYGLVAPALPLFARQFGVGKAAAGAVVSAFALMRLATAPFVGRLVNAFGERIMLATGIGVVAVSSALGGLAQSAVRRAAGARVVGELARPGVDGVALFLYCLSSPWDK